MATTVVNEHNYGKSPFIVDFPMKKWWIFP